MEAKPIKAYKIGDRIVVRHDGDDGEKGILQLDARNPILGPVVWVSQNGIHGRLGELEGEQALLGAIVKSGIFG